MNGMGGRLIYSCLLQPWCMDLQQRVLHLGSEFMGSYAG